MKILNEILDDLQQFKKDFNVEHNCCLEIFNTVMEKNVNEDIYLSAKAFTSLVNCLVNKKIEYVNYLISNQIELLSFLNTYDGKYLSNAENLLVTSSSSEIAMIDELIEDVFNIISFLEDFLKTISNEKKTKLPKHIEAELNDMLMEFEKKYERGDYFEG